MEILRQKPEADHEQAGPKTNPRPFEMGFGKNVSPTTRPDSYWYGYEDALKWVLENLVQKSGGDQ